jgi:hypothetical protein
MRSPIHLLRALCPTRIPILSSREIKKQQTRLDTTLGTVEEGVACRIGDELGGPMVLQKGVDKMSSPIASLVLGLFGRSCTDTVRRA